MRVRRNVTPQRGHRGLYVKGAFALGVVGMVAQALLPAGSRPDGLGSVSTMCGTLAPSPSPPATSLPVGDTPGTLKIERGQFYTPPPIPALQALMMDDMDEPNSESAPELRLVTRIQLLGDRSHDVTWLFR